MAQGSIHIGVGGWTYEPWDDSFYPADLKKKDQLRYSASQLTAIEINGTYYSTFKPDSWLKWRDETPDDFVFSVKASRYCTNRKVLSDMAIHDPAAFAAIVDKVKAQLS